MKKHLAIAACLLVSAAVLALPLLALAGGSAAVMLADATTVVSTDVKSLLHFDGSNGSTTITQTVPGGPAFARSGTAALSTAQVKYGTASVAVDSGSNYVSSGSSADFGYGTADFTIQFWAYPTSYTGGVQALYDQRTSGSQPRPCIYILANMYYYVNGANRITTTVPSLNAWHAFAISRYMGTTYLYVDGTSVGSWVDTTNYTTSPIYIGTAGDSVGAQGFNGFVDEMRVTKGVGLFDGTSYTPTGPFTYP